VAKNNVQKRLAEVEKLRSQLPSPPLASAPFGERQAKQHQQRWAEHLGVPVIETNSIGMKLVLIPPGEFLMGSTDEEITVLIVRDKWDKSVATEGPRHRAKISKPFFLGMYSVTQREYEKVMGNNPSAFTERQMEASGFKPPLAQRQIEERGKDVQRVTGKDTSRHPVETVSWDDAIEFCRRLSATPAERAARRVYRLPTEAEWEYACRAGTTTRWSFGDDEASLRECAWFWGNSGATTHPVGEKKPNAWGLYDMEGNVLQWCADWFSADYYEQSPPNDPTGPPAGLYRVSRGSRWNIINPKSSRSASRNHTGPADARFDTIGFRVVVGP
jgi:formylglycine-generating enzyme required for sulfatase activity